LQEGELNFGAACFVISYVIVAMWTVLQVTVAVLLDKFINASMQLEAEERAKRREAKDSHNLLRSTMVPLLARLTKDYINDTDLGHMLRNLFQMLDTNFSGSLSCLEFCSGIRKLVSQTD